ncbi:fimbrial protein [Salmonella enterica]|nr:fimbrial protein [Salmonella enterica]
MDSISSLNSKNIDVHIDPQMYISPDQSGRVLIDLFRDMKCRNDFTGFIDKIYINSTITDVPVVLTDTAGVYVNGSKIANETLAITLPYENGIWRSVPVQVMAKLSRVPGQSDFLHAGSKLLTLYMRQTNNRGASVDFFWHFYTTRDLTVSSSLCTINNDSAFEVDLGSAPPSGFGNTYHTTRVRKEFVLPLSCPETTVNERVKITLYGTVSIGIPNALQTTNANMGIQIVDAVRDEIISPGSYTTTNIVNGKGSIRLLAAAIKKADVSVVAGQFSANAIVAMSHD